jgi:copper chaperone CopZ
MTIKVNGMHCKSCREVIEDELMAMDCVQDADVSLEHGTAKVDLENGCTEAIIEAIERLGYKAKVQE